MSPTERTSARSPTIFLSYAAADASIGRAIADDLRRAGLQVTSPEFESASPTALAPLLTDAVRASDVMLLLLSPDSVRSFGAHEERLSVVLSDLSDRAIPVLPALVADCEVPRALGGRQALDLRSGHAHAAQTLAQRLTLLPDIDFSKLDYRDFERLVADLLVEIGFDLKEASRFTDYGFDLDARYGYEGPFGPESDRWLVEIKLYQHRRFSIGSVHQLVGALHSYGASKGLIVTSSQPTSAAREFVRQVMDRTGLTVKIIDGATLTAMLLERPRLLRRYFPG